MLTHQSDKLLNDSSTFLQCSGHKSFGSKSRSMTNYKTETGLSSHKTAVSDPKTENNFSKIA